MTEPIKDDERLSALVEGRVAGPEREELLAHLSTSEDDYEVFTDTVEILSALEEEDARAAKPEPAVIPFRPAPRRHAPSVPLRRAAAAAGIILISALALALALRGGASSRVSPVQLASLADPAEEGLPDGWTDDPRWSGQYRGGDAIRDQDVQSVRAGVLLAELSVAVQAGDTAETELLAALLSNRFEGGVGGTTPLRALRNPGGASPDSLNALVQRATDRLVSDGGLGRKPLETGAWIGAARVAAERRHEPFFRDGRTGGMLDRAERMGRGDDAARGAVERIRTNLAEGTPRWDALRDDLDALLSALAS